MAVATLAKTTTPFPAAWTLCCSPPHPQSLCCCCTCSSSPHCGWDLALGHRSAHVPCRFSPLPAALLPSTLLYFTSASPQSPGLCLPSVPWPACASSLSFSMGLPSAEQQPLCHHKRALPHGLLALWCQFAGQHQPPSSWWRLSTPTAPGCSSRHGALA